MEINIDVDSKEFFRKFKGIKDDQMPFAFARSLTWTAQNVQEAEIKDLPQRFTLRTKWYLPQTPYGFKVEPAKKTNLTSAIYTRAPWIIGFEEGEIRQPSGKVFAAPQPAVKRTKRDLIAPSQKPKKILHRSTRPAFILPTKLGSGIFRRTRKGGPLMFMYALIKRARITPRLRFKETAERIVAQKFPENFKKSFEDALRTAR